MERPIRSSLARFWPWLVLAMATIPSVWYVLDYEDDIDPELPAVVRPTFNRYPPAAYRFAEAGDTIDHVAVYVASAALVLAAWGWFRNARSRGWAAATVVSAAGFWHAATPGPLADGWYGLGWRIILDPRAPVANRLIMAGLTLGVVAMLLWALVERPLRSVWLAAKDRGVLGLSIAAALLIAARQVAWLDVEPIGFWPRWLYVWGMFAWSFVLVRLAPAAPLGWSRNAIVAAMVLVSLGLDFAGRGLFWYQRPIHRLREVDPGRIYVSAMPTYQGLKLAQERYHFRTIINLFPESTPEQSPHWPDELRFAREHGLKYVGNPARDGTGSDGFIAETLELSRDPAAWPILVHCHASMDRSPAWMAMYRFVVQGWPLADAIKELERHRGLRPRASVTVLYDEVLPRLAPERCAADPTFALLKQFAEGTNDFRAQAADRAVIENSAVVGRNVADSAPLR
jgi:protein tyrosine phosphatase (PTP) superfamily phosphohydrolase (DUF442 family)